MEFHLRSLLGQNAKLTSIVSREWAFSNAPQLIPFPPLARHSLVEIVSPFSFSNRSGTYLTANSLVLRGLARSFVAECLGRRQERR